MLMVLGCGVSSETGGCTFALLLQSGASFLHGSSWGFSWLFPACRKRQTWLCRAVEEQFVCLGLGGPWFHGSSTRNVSPPQYPQPQRRSGGGFTNVSPQLRTGGSGAAGMVFPPPSAPLPWSSTRGSRWEPPHPARYVGERPPRRWEQLLPRCPELLGSRRRCGEEDKSFGWSKGSCSARLPGCWD